MQEKLLYCHKNDLYTLRWWKRKTLTLFIYYYIDPFSCQYRVTACLEATPDTGQGHSGLDTSPSEGALAPTMGNLKESIRWKETGEPEGEHTQG